MVWIDYKKAYNMVPDSCISECLERFGLPEHRKFKNEARTNIV